MAERLLTARELAAHLGVSPDVVYRKTHEWPCFRVGQLVRFDLDEVKAHLRSVEPPAGEPEAEAS